MATAALTMIETAKRLAAFRAVAEHLAPTATHVGIGSGSTVVYVVEAISELPSTTTAGMTFVPTGYQSRDLITAAGLRLGAIDSLGEGRMLDVCFDGADEVDEDLNLIKGGGACLFQEKLVAISSKKFICVADERKLSARLLTIYPTIPIEVVPPSAPSVLRALRALGSPKPRLRLAGTAKAGPVVTDNSNFIIDIPFPAPLVPGEVEALAMRMKQIVGVVEVGLFTGLNGEEVAAKGGEGGGQKPVAAYFGMQNGEVVVRVAEGAAST